MLRNLDKKCRSRITSQDRYGDKERDMVRDRDWYREKRLEKRLGHDTVH